MKKIYAKIIEMADAKIIKEKLIALIEKINKSDYTERLINTLFDADIKENEIPYKVKHYNEIRTRKSFDYLNDRVDYDYTRTDTRYFANEADAIEYSKSGNYDYSTSKNVHYDGYSYKAEYVVCSNSWCNLDEWMSDKVIEK